MYQTERPVAGDDPPDPEQPQEDPQDPHEPALSSGRTLDALAVAVAPPATPVRGSCRSGRSMDWFAGARIS